MELTPICLYGRTPLYSFLFFLINEKYLPLFWFIFNFCLFFYKLHNLPYVTLAIMSFKNHIAHFTLVIHFGNSPRYYAKSYWVALFSAQVASCDNSSHIIINLLL